MSFPVRFVLYQPTHPGNVGASARAIKTMGFSDLVLVNPRNFPSPDADARASGAVDVLSAASVVGSLADAVADCGLIIGASARRRRLGSLELTPRQCAAELLAHCGQMPVAIVFGTESAGLSNTELDLCNGTTYIPANPDYSSLNLAMAVQVIAYELRVAQGYEDAPQDPESPPASSGDMELFYKHLERVLLATGFLKPDNPRYLMRRLRRLFNRTRLDQNELNIMRGILSAVVPGSGDAPDVPGNSESAISDHRNRAS
jgi:TrmH family RNA methyltransferase